MPAYDFRCDTCAQVTEEYQHLAATTRTIACPLCGGLARKVLVFPKGNPSPFLEHFNTAVGSHVTSKREFGDKLKAASDRQSARTGLAHNYVPVDLRDREACGVTDEGLDATRKHRVDSGMVETKRYV
jgi:putative FmdB family regulatory protein